MNRRTGNRSLARNLAVVGAGLALWGALVLLFSAPLAWTSSLSWLQVISFGISFWLLWLFFLPAVAWLALSFPIERRTLLRTVGLHLLACLLIVGANRANYRTIAGIIPRPHPTAPKGAPGPPGPPGALGVFPSLRAALDVLVYGSLVGVCQAITNFRRSQERERRAAELEAKLASAELQALRMQINPHFLFNTLNSIAALVHTNPQAADEMLSDLSELLRRSLDSMEEQEIPLAQEIEFIGTYLSIEQKRFGDRLRLEQRVPSELTKALVPALILQPLIENAIRHGIEQQRGPALISIEAKENGRRLHLIVRDNGRGLSDAGSSVPARRGIGLANTQARLLALYGRDQSFSIGKIEPEGCQVDINLPLHTEPVRIPTASNRPAA